jgi:hypothetical protein
MPVFVPDEVVTAAKMNLIYKPQAGGNGDTRTFTNASFLDLDALTGGAGTVAAVIVSVTTETSAIVVVSANNLSASAGSASLTYRVSGATTIAAVAGNALRAVGIVGASKVDYLSGLTPGVNVFELQASVSGGGTGTVSFPELIVIPI